MQAWMTLLTHGYHQMLAEGQEYEARAAEAVGCR